MLRMIAAIVAQKPGVSAVGAGAGAGGTTGVATGAARTVRACCQPAASSAAANTM